MRKPEIKDRSKFEQCPLTPCWNYPARRNLMFRLCPGHPCLWHRHISPLVCSQPLPFSFKASCTCIGHLVHCLLHLQVHDELIVTLPHALFLPLTEEYLVFTFNLMSLVLCFVLHAGQRMSFNGNVRASSYSSFSAFQVSPFSIALLQACAVPCNFIFSGSTLSLDSFHSSMCFSCRAPFYGHDHFRDISNIFTVDIGPSSYRSLPVFNGNFL